MVTVCRAFKVSQAPDNFNGNKWKKITLQLFYENSCPRFLKTEYTLLRDTTIMGGAMNYYVLFYEVVDDYLQRRTQFREEHLDLVKRLHERGEILLGGALADPADRVLVVFHTDNPGIIDDFVNKDPYVRNGLVARWKIRPWTVVIGNVAE